MLYIHKSSGPTIQNISGFIISVFFFLFPFITTNYFLYGPTTLRSLNLILVTSVVGVMMSSILCIKKSQLSFRLSPITIALFVYLVVLLISALQGLDFGNSFWSLATRMTGLWYLIHLGLFIFFIVDFIKTEKNLRRIILCITTSTALYSVCSLFGYEGLKWMFLSVQNDAFTFGNSTFAGMYIFAAFILSLYYIYQSQEKKWWMYIIPGALVINPYILNRNIWIGDMSSGFVGEARASAYVIILSLFFILLSWIVSKIRNVKYRNRTIYSLFFIGTIALVFSAYSLLSPSGVLRDVYMKQAAGARPLVWEMSGNIISQKPILGFGPDNFERVYESHYDNRILEEKYGAEAWFDRAHNIFLDSLIDTGILGLVSYLLVYLTVIFCLILVITRSPHRGDRVYANFLIIWFTLHIAELQTAFDTSISYPIIAFMLASVIVLVDRLPFHGVFKEYAIPFKLKVSIGSIVIIFCIWSLIWGWLPVMRSQIANGYIRTVGSAEGRIPEYKILFNSPVDMHSLLWRTVVDFQRGIGQNPRVLESPDKVAMLRKEIQIFEDSYKAYVKENPTHFRALLNLADVLIYERLFGIDKLKEAQLVLDNAIKLVPQAPQPYWMKAVAYLYMRKFPEAKEYAKKSLDINPNITQSQDLVKYIDKSIKTFPEIDLYFFRQI